MDPLLVDGLEFVAAAFVVLMAWSLFGYQHWKV